MPDWVGTWLFLTAVGLTGSKLASDFGKRGLLGYGMLMVLVVIYAAAVAVAFNEL